MSTIKLPAHPNLALGDEPGISLAEALVRCGPFDLERVRELGRDLCAGLHAAHAEGVGHGRLSPAWVRVLPDHFAVAGLGLEQAQRGARIDERDDVRGVGAVLYQALTGVEPFGADVETLPAPLRAPILRALQPAADRRHGTLAELAEALGTPVIVPEAEPKRPGLGLSRRATVLALVAALAAGGVSAWRTFRARGARQVAIPAAPPAPAPPPRPVVVAVTAFQGVSLAPDERWLARGARELLAAELDATPGVEVVRAHDTDPAAARSAGIDLILDGDVERSPASGGGLFVEVKLLDVTSGALRFAERAPLAAPGDLISAGDGLARKLPAACGVPADSTARLAPPTGNAEAWQAYVAGLETKDDAQAEEAFRRAASLDPRFFQARTRWAELLLAAGRSEAAAVVLAEARALVPQAGEGAALALRRLEARSAPERVAAGKAWVARRPHDARLALELAQALRSAGEARACAAEAQRAAGLDPGLSEAVRVVAWCDLEAGEAAAALAAAEAHAKATGATETLGDVLLALGRFADAREAYRQAGPASLEAAAHALLVDVHGTGRCLMATRAGVRLAQAAGNPSRRVAEAIARNWAQAALSCQDVFSAHEAEAWLRKVARGSEAADEIALWAALARGQGGLYARAVQHADDEARWVDGGSRARRFGPLLAAARGQGKSADALARVGAPEPSDRLAFEWRPLLLEIALSRLEIGAADEAARACHELRAAAPGYVPGLYCLARAAEARKEYAEAARRYREFLERWAGADPENKLVRDTKGRLPRVLREARGLASAPSPNPPPQ